MRKIIFLFITIFLTVSHLVFASSPTDGNWPVAVNNASAVWGQSITDNLTTHQTCRAVYVGTSQSIDLTFDGSTWVTYQGAVAGTVLDVQVKGARKTSGGSAPSSGDVVFEY